MKNSTRKFITLLDKENINYTVHTESTSSEKSDVLFINNNGDNMRQTLLLAINDCDAQFYLRIAEVPETKRNLITKEINKLNCKYRYIKFYLEDDGKLNATTSFIFNNCCVDYICMGMAINILQIADECYPSIMKIVW